MVIKTGEEQGYVERLKGWRMDVIIIFFFFQAEDGIRDIGVTGVQTCALPISEVRAEVNETFKIKGLKKSRRDTIKHVLGGKPIGYLQSVLNLPLGSTKTYSFSSPNRGLETGSSATRSPTLTTEPRCLL